MNFSVISADLWRIIKLPLKIKLPDNSIKLIMRIGIVSLVILTTSIQLFSATPVKSQAIDQVEISIELKNETLVKAFKKIEAKSPFHFMYRNDDVKNIRNLHVHSGKQSVAAWLKAILSNTSLNFKQIDKRIMIMPSLENSAVGESSNLVNEALSAKVAIKGKVTDEKGEPLPGVNVKAEGFNIGTVTNINGEYEINVEEGTTLLFSYIGFATQKILVNGKTRIDVILQIDEAGRKLQEVVVIGYGTQKKRDVTGSVSSVTADSYKDQPVLTTATALQGRAAGVSISSNTGAPGGSVKIRIRGANSINADNNPLIVLDGVALSNVSLQDINVNDVASMDILKDASATAIYGSRGANGVIMITTKSGQTGKDNLSYNTFVSFNRLPKKYDLMNAASSAAFVNHITGTATFPNPQSLGVGTNWQDEIYRTGKSQNHQLSVNGGNEKTKYYISGYYVDQDGIVLNTGQTKYSVRSNVSTKIGSKVNVGLNLFAAHSKAHNNGDLGSKGSSVLGALTWAATEPVYNSPGIYNRSVSTPTALNPLMLAQESLSDNVSNSAIINGNIKYDITNWLSLSATAALDMSLTKGSFLNNEWINPTTQSSGQSSGENYTSQYNGVLTFHKVLNKIHDLTATAVYEQTSNTNQLFSANGSGLSSTSYSYYNLALNNGSQSIGSAYTNWGLQSYVGRLSYSLNNKYLLTATYRADGSSKFQRSSNKWSYFPSVAVGWRLAEESFIKDLNIFSNLKLRASWGETGNQAILPYESLGVMGQQQYTYGTIAPSLGYSLGNPSNPDLKWETTAQTDIGLDIGVLNDKLSFSIDYYNKNTTDVLLQKPIPIYNGGGFQIVNLGEVNNKGFEFSLSANAVKTKDFSWKTAFNLSAFKNKVVSLGDQSLINIGAGDGFMRDIQVVKVGEPLASFYLIPWNGIYQTGQGALGSVAGDNNYTDVNGNGSIGMEDRVISGNAMPKLQWGFNNDFSYKIFSVNMFWQASHGNKMFNATYAATAIPSSDMKYPTLAEVANFWTPQNTGSQWADPASSTNRSYVESTQFLQNASYVRLKNISLSYTLSKKMIGLSDVRLSLSGQNLLTITKYKGYDPESDTAGNGDLQSGIDKGAYPNPKTYTVGLNVKF